MPDNDAVIQRLATDRDNDHAAVSTFERKLADATKNVVRRGGLVNSAASLEVAQRQIELDVLRERAEAADAALEHAHSDAGRRKECRQRAAVSRAAVGELEAGAAKLRQKLAEIERRKAERLAAAERHAKRAEFTQAELDEKREAAEAARAETERHNTARRNGGFTPDPLPEIPAFLQAEAS